jgi:hypothetical protein
VPSLEGFKQVRVRVFWSGGDHQLMTLRAPTPEPTDPLDPEDPTTPPDGPLDEVAAADSLSHAKDKLRLDLLNETDEFKTVESISLSASAEHPRVERIRLEKESLYEPDPPGDLPTGTIDVTSTAWAKRTFEPGEELRLRIDFEDKPSGVFDYELVIAFDDGTASTVFFTIAW